jgi:galactonate dehydratase
MKITAVTSYPVKVGFRNQFIVKIDTDEGISGVGEGGMSGRELGMAGMVEHLSRWLIGEDPGRIEHLWQTCYRTSYFEGGNILTAALSAIDIALWDIQGKRFGVPVYELLGGACRDYLPCFATPGGLDGPEIVEKARQMYAEGWTVQRFLPVMRSTLKDDASSSEIFEPLEAIDLAAEWLEKIRDEVGSGLNLAIDFHHRLNAAESALFCKRVEHLNLYFLEEPMRSENPRAYQQLRSMTSVPFAIGEEFASPFAFVPWIEDGITNFVRVDLSNAGGISASRKIAAMAEMHYIDVMPHNPLGPITTAASIHFGLATPNFSYLEYQHRLADDYDPTLFPVMPRIDGPNFPKPTEPGLGVVFDHEVAAERAFEFWDAPRWRRNDGSYQNW